MMTVRSPVPPEKPARANPLRQAADEPDRGGRSERGPVVMVDLVAQARIADLIESQKLIEAQRAAVWHQEPVKRHCEPASLQAPERVASRRERVPPQESARAVRCGSTPDS